MLPSLFHGFLSAISSFTTTTSRVNSIMNDKDSDNAFMIQAYFDDLEKRIAFLKELYDGNHTDEALMLCCCYIEALGSRQYHDSDRKAKNYYRILVEHSGNKLFTLIHPKQLRNVLLKQKVFKSHITRIEPVIDGFGMELIPQKVVTGSLSPVITEDQVNWLNDNLFKGTMAAISYDEVRSKLVHDISTSSLSFSKTTFDGKPVPDMNFDLLYPALMNIFHSLKGISFKTNKWHWE